LPLKRFFFSNEQLEKIIKIIKKNLIT